MRKRFEQGQETPAWKNRPELYDDLAHVWRAWVELHAGRQWVSLGMGGCAPQPIPFADFTAWLDFHEVEDESTRREIVEYVRALDMEFVAWSAKVRASSK